MLLAVLAIVGSALLVVTGLAFITRAEVAGVGQSDESAQARALAWSGVQAAAARLNDQRQKIFDGQIPQLEQQYVIYEAGTRLGVVRLMPASTSGQGPIAEAGRIDLNHADAAALTATGLIDADLAAAIIHDRDAGPQSHVGAAAGPAGRPYQSVGDLLGVPGMTATLLYGPPGEAPGEGGSTAGASGAETQDGSPVAPRGLADLLTVHGVEPALQRNGKLQINLNVPWSDELGARIEEQFGHAAATGFKQVFAGGTKIDSEAKLIELLGFYRVPVRDWVRVIDAFTTEAGEFRAGRLDINTASYEALLSLPGLSTQQAAQIVQLRRDLTSDQRATKLWPVLIGIVAPEAFGSLAGRITTRSWTYRIRLEAGEVDASNSDGPLRHPVRMEAVIDLSAPRPRVAYLRDVTLLRTAQMIVAAGLTRSNAEASGSEGPGDTDDPSPQPDAEPESTSAPAATDAAKDEPPVGGKETVAAGSFGAEAATQGLADEDAAPPALSPARRIGRWTAGGAR